MHFSGSKKGMLEQHPLAYSHIPRRILFADYIFEQGQEQHERRQCPRARIAEADGDVKAVLAALEQELGAVLR